MALGMGSGLARSERARGSRRMTPPQATGGLGASTEKAKQKKLTAAAWKETRALIAARRGRLALGLGLMLVNRATGLVLPATSKYLIDDVIGKGRVEWLMPLAIAAGAATLVQAVTSFALSQVLGVAAQRAITDMRRRVEAHVARLPVRYFDSTQSGALVSRVMNDAEGIRNLVGTGLVQLIGSIVTAAAAVVILFYLNSTLTLITLVVLLTFGAAMWYAFRTVRPVFRERGKIYAEVTGRLTETIGGIRIVKTYTAEKREELVFTTGVHRLFRNVAKTITSVSGITAFGTIVIGAIGLVMIVVGGRAILAGEMTVGDFITYILFTGLMAAPVMQIAAIGTQVSEAFAGLDRIHELMEMPTEDAEDTTRAPLGVLNGEVAFEDVSFEYNEGVPVLKDVSFRAPAGTTTALVGSSGSGKSTLISLVMAFNRPKSGRVLIDGRDLATVRLHDYRSQLGVVLQDNFLFDGTIAENIRYGRPTATLEEIRDVSRIAHADEFIEGFEKKYETVVGERGVKLSGGQRQRVAIARAILANPRILGTRRSHVLTRQRKRSAHPGRPQIAAQGQDDVRHRTPPVDHPQRRPDPGARAWRDRRAGDARRVAPARRALSHVVRQAVQTGSRQVHQSRRGFHAHTSRGRCGRTGAPDHRRLDQEMPQFIYTMKGLGKVHEPDHVVLKDIWLSFLPGAKIGVLGLNGSGKSTLLRIMAGEDHDFLGEAYPADGISIGFLPQEPRLDASKNVLGNVEEGVSEIRGLLNKYDEINAKFGEELSPEEMDKVLEEQGKIQDRIEAAQGWDLDSRVELAMDALRLPPADADVSTLSGGERRRVALCRLLLRSPDLLLLDEPTNHLDAESVAWLERFLKDYPGTVVAVTHDRYFLDNVAGWILELDRGSGIPWEGNYSSWLEQKQNRLALEEKSETKRQRTLQRELEWIRMSPRARQAKGKARLNAYEELLREDTAQKIDQIEIYIPPGPRLGDTVIEARGLRKAYGDLLLMDDMDFTLPRAGIVGVIGPNGAGKTTLFRMITGQEKPDDGTLKLGETVQVGYVDQSRDSLAADKSVWEEITGGVDEVELGKRTVASRAYVSWFNFKGRDQQRKVGALSGGERNRVHLAKLLKRGSNLLLLDEPTNDLDVDTLRALEEALLNFAGCAVVISHDRWFLDRIATHMLAFEGDSKVVWFAGNYQDYEADRKRRLGAEADQPHRIKYRKLTR